MSDARNVIALRPAVAEPERITALESQVAVLIVAVAELRAEIDALKPPPRFTIPPTWLTVKRAAALSGYAPPTVSEWARERKITSNKIGGRRYVDPSSLPRKGT